MSAEAAMEKRLRALLRKTLKAQGAAGILGFTSAKCPEADALVAAVLPHMKLKREYEEVFTEAANTEAFCTRIQLSPPHASALLLMQANKDVFIPNPILDNILTAIFLAEVAWVLYDMWRHAHLPAFLLGMLVVDACVVRVKDVSRVVGNVLSNAVVRAGMVDIPPLSGNIQMKKWQEQAWQLVVHVGAAYVEWSIISGETWWQDTVSCWVPHPFTQTFSTLHEGIYLAQLIIWMYTCVIHRFFDERRKDYFIMYAHHVVTIALVSSSYSMMVLRIGLLVLYVHDVSDILVDLLKMVNFLKLEDRRGWYASEIVYVACIISWVYWRLYEFPFRVIRGVVIDAKQTLAKNPNSCDGFLCLFPEGLPGYIYFNAMLISLLIMHIYWGHLFIMIGYRILTESTREASRQEYEGDSDDETVNDLGRSRSTGGDSSAPPSSSADAHAVAPSPVVSPPVEDAPPSSNSSRSKARKRAAGRN